MKIGLLTPDLNCPEAMKLIEGLDSPFLFFEDYSPMPYKPSFSCMGIVEAYSFEGVLIATNITTANKLIGMPSATKKYYYVEHPEWLNIKGLGYEDFAKIYRCVPIVVPNEEMQRIMRNAFNVECEVMNLECLLTNICTKST